VPETTRQGQLPEKPRRPLLIAFAWILLGAALVMLGGTSNVAAQIGGLIPAVVGIWILVVEYDQRGAAPASRRGKRAMEESWEREHYDEDARPDADQEWPLLVTSFVWARDGVFEVSMRAAGQETPLHDPSSPYGSMEEARQGANTLVAKVHPHACGRRCTSWKRAGAAAGLPT
jgi:hypothetical protein